MNLHLITMNALMSDVFEKIVANLVVIKPDAHINQNIVDVGNVNFQFRTGEVSVISTAGIEEKILLILNYVLQISKKSEAPILLFLALKEAEFGMLCIRSISNIDIANLRMGRLSDSELPRLTEAVEKLRNLPLYYSNNFAIAVLESRLKTFQQKFGKIGTILLDADCLAAVKKSALSEGRSIKLSELQRFENLAKKWQYPVLLFTTRECQVNSLAWADGVVSTSPPVRMESISIE